MLQKLSIRNYALIDNVEIDLDKGLNIITGETGAGKSIILGALSLILGQRAETKYFFNQEKKCIIEGTFKLSGGKFAQVFEEHDLDFHEESTLRREISIDGKSRAFINDTPVTLSVMKNLGERLIDIHSQHATRELNDPSFQLAVVDGLANHEVLLFKYREDFKLYKKNQHQLRELRKKADEARNKQDYEQFLFNELEQAQLLATEQEVLETELQALNNAENIKRSLLNSSQLLSEEEASVVNLLKEAISQLHTVESFNTSYSELAERLRSGLIEIKDIGNELSLLEADVIFNPTRIEEITERLDLLYTLQQKHRVNTVQDLINIQEELSLNLSLILSGDEEIERLHLQTEKIKAELDVNANTLSTNRSKSIKATEKQVDQILAQAGMPNAKIKIEQTVLKELTKDGKDNIVLLFSANSGQPPAPVAKVASGGELSRIMLAIKSILAKHSDLPTLIFDEIDTGISGETALRVGQVIGQLERNMQVVCITHLPQIAAKGNAHFFVHKHESADRSTTAIKRLDREGRVYVIAEMLSGKPPGKSAMANARDLLDKGQLA